MKKNERDQMITGTRRLLKVFAVAAIFAMLHSIGLEATAGIFILVFAMCGLFEIPPVK